MYMFYVLVVMNTWK